MQEIDQRGLLYGKFGRRRARANSFNLKRLANYFFHGLPLFPGTRKKGEKPFCRREKSKESKKKAAKSEKRRKEEESFDGGEL